MNGTEDLGIPAYIKRHEAEIKRQRERMESATATSTRFLAAQRIQACEAAIRVLRARQDAAAAS